MSTITLRSAKGSPLTNNEVDANFTNINDDKLEISNNLSDLASASTALTNLGLTATSAEINYTAGVTSAIQTQIDALQRPSIAVTVADSGSGNKFYLDGTEQQIARLIPSVTYKFDQSDSSNSGHPLLLSTTADGTHGGGSSYTVGVTAVGTPGTAGAYTEVKLEQDAPDTLYYYCVNHAGMGGEVTVRAGSVTLVDLGVTASAAELNTLTGITASTSELNTLTGIPATLTATELGYVDGVTSSIQTQIDSLGSSSGTTLTKTFAAGESYIMTLSDNVLVPVVSVTKEVSQTGVSNNDWDVNSTSENYTRYNTAPAVTLTPSAVGDGTFTLGSGSFSSSDVGKIIEGNGGVAILTATDGSYVTTTDFTDTSAIASGSWEMYALKYNTTDGDLELSSYADIYNFGSRSQLGSQTFYGVVSAATSPTGIHFRPNGARFWTVDNDNDKIMQWDMSPSWSDTTLGYDYQFDVSSQMTAPQDISVPPPGNYIFVCDTNEINRYNLSSAYNLNFSTSHSQTYSSNAGGHGMDISHDGTKLFFVSDGAFEISYHTMSTPYDLSTASFSGNMGVSNFPSSGAKAIRFKDNGKRLLVLKNDGTMYEWSLVTGYDLSSSNVTYVGSTSMSLPDSTTNGFDTGDNGKYLYTVGSNARFYIATIGSGVSIPSGYHAAHTTTSTDTTYWTDINSMIADEVAGDGNVYYCVSTDDRTTWKVADDSNGIRSIVRNNSGTWQYNSNSTYGSETWTDGTTNDELATVQESMGTSQNRMDKTQLDAVSDSNHFTLANDLDLAIIMTVSSGSTVPSSDGVAINYDANVLNQGAILGTDYNYDAPAQNKVRITSVNGANLKVRVI